MQFPAYFISDLHLGCNPDAAVPDREQKVIAFLRSLRGQASHVVLVGDVFEFWMEYKDYVNRNHFGFLRVLAELVESGVQVHYLAGNHDFRLDDFFPHTLGVQVHRTLKLQIQGHTIWVQHGDGAAKQDWKYRVASRILHSKTNVWLFRLLHPDWGMALARWVGSTSRHANMHKDPLLTQYTEWAAQTMQRESCDALVQGHNHHGGVWDMHCGTHANCGQWLYSLSYVELREGKFRFVEVEGEKA